MDLDDPAEPHDAGIRDRWSHGKHDHEFEGKPLRVLPESAAERPSGDALRWHDQRLFVA